MSKKHLHNQAAIPLAPAVFKVSKNCTFVMLYNECEFSVFFVPYFVIFTSTG